MIVSFHPLFETDQYILCAGREPDDNDLAAIKKATAVILPQGCREILYEMAADNCQHVFPNYDARFAYPGKLGQIKLFQKSGTPHPISETFLSLDTFRRQYGESPQEIALDLPCVFKFDWGGEGETVYLINTPQDLWQALQKADRYERTGQKGFMLQQYVSTQGRILRVVVIGRTLISYWRIQESADVFISNVVGGARIDSSLAPDLQRVAKKFVKGFCIKTGINLAGFDVIFRPSDDSLQPLMLEINYFFGRRGLGGSDAYYEMLKAEIQNWMASVLGETET